MLKRIFCLAMIALAGLLVWTWLRQRENDFANVAPRLAPAAPPPNAMRHAAPTPPAAAPPAPAEEPLAAAPSAPAEEPPAAAAEPAERRAPVELVGVIGYCVRCKTKRPIAGAHEEITESGRRAARGTCSVCGAKIFTFLATE